MRYKRADRPIKKRISIRESLIERVEEQIADPFTGRTNFGAWAKLIEALLVKWLNGEVTVPVKLRRAPPPFCPTCLKDITPDIICLVEDCPITIGAIDRDTLPTSKVPEGSLGNPE